MSLRAMRALAETNRKLGQRVEAQSCTSRAVAVFAQVNDRLGVAECLETLGLLRGEGDGAATLIGAAIAVRRTINAAEDVVMKHAEAVRLKAACPVAWAKGEAMTIADATAFAAQVTTALDVPSTKRSRSRSPRRSPE